ncbi:MAG: alanine racemase [candidate division Zixibacteria bacterium]|nr:alanine racemase [candidate division Zixibacteria bacterium]
MIKQNSNKYLRPAYLEIDLKALASNLKNIKKRLGEKVELLAVVKADAYGHGAYEVSRITLKSGADSLGVAILEEGIELREKGIKAPIQILYPESLGREKKIAKYNLQPVVIDYDFAFNINRESAKKKKITEIFLKIDTGMRRYGLEPAEALDFFGKIKKLKNLKVKGVLSQFSSTEEEDRGFAEYQLSLFKSTIEQLEEENGNRLKRSIANSGAVLEIPQSYFDQVRVGILLYGLYPFPRTIEKVKVHPVMSLKSKLLQIREVPEGTSVGYGRGYYTRRKTRIGTIPVGYADGYPRILSNKGEVLIKGKKAPIIGRVCMDAFMVDLTDIPEVKTGEEVILLGRQGKESIDAEKLGEWSQSLNYEIITRMGKRLPRIYV